MTERKHLIRSNHNVLQYLAVEKGGISNNLLIQWSSGWVPLDITFVAAVKSFDANIAISDNFVLTAKNSNMVVQNLDFLSGSCVEVFIHSMFMIFSEWYVFM